MVRRGSLMVVRKSWSCVRKEGKSYGLKSLEAESDWNKPLLWNRV